MKGSSKGKYHLLLLFYFRSQKYCIYALSLNVIICYLKRSRKGFEVAKADQIADIPKGQQAHWPIGMMADRPDFERLRGFCDKWTDRLTEGQTDRRTFAILESLSQLKKS